MFEDAPHDIFVIKQRRIMLEDKQCEWLSKQRSLRVKAGSECSTLLQKLIILINQTWEKPRARQERQEMLIDLKKASSWKNRLNILKVSSVFGFLLCNCEQ